MDVRVLGITGSSQMMLSEHGIDLADWQQSYSRRASPVVVVAPCHQQCVTLGFCPVMLISSAEYLVSEHGIADWQLSYSWCASLDDLSYHFPCHQHCLTCHSVSHQRYFTRHAVSRGCRMYHCQCHCPCFNDRRLCCKTSEPMSYYCSPTRKLHHQLWS